jgi:hypothetical protein
MKNFITLICLIFLVSIYANAQEKVEIAKNVTEKAKAEKPLTEPFNGRN